jgi:hypothetical protein
MRRRDQSQRAHLIPAAGWRLRLDLTGVVLSALGLMLLLYPLVQDHDLGDRVSPESFVDAFEVSLAALIGVLAVVATFTLRLPKHARSA